MNPPNVTEVARPSAHKTNRMTKIVQSMMYSSQKSRLPAGETTPGCLDLHVVDTYHDHCITRAAIGRTSNDLQTVGFYVTRHWRGMTRPLASCSQSGQQVWPAT